jgi:glyoxalase family protein
MMLDGLHHVTAITGDIDANLEFYGRLLGLRLVWQGVNADEPEMRHIAYGDERGSPGSIITFFDMPGVARGRPGAGMVHRLLLRVAGGEALDFWDRRLARAGIAGERTADRLAFSDPEGLRLALVIDDGEDAPLIAAAADIEAPMAIRGMHAVRAYGADPGRSTPVVRGVLGLEPDGEGRWLARGGLRHGLVIYDQAPPERGVMGAGTMHHIAFAIRDGEQDSWRVSLAASRLRPTPVLDRRMFKSIYFREPSGVLFELATDRPGFVFEPSDRLGESLVLIGDLENRRGEIERRFPPLPNPRSTGPASRSPQRTSARCRGSV